MSRAFGDIPCRRIGVTAEPQLFVHRLSAGESVPDVTCHPVISRWTILPLANLLKPEICCVWLEME
jgi:hypothetical protein